MVQKKSSKHESTAVHEKHELEVSSFEVKLSAGISDYLISEANAISRDDPIYDACLTLVIMTKCLCPKRFKGEDVKVVMSSSDRNGRFDKCVGDVYIRDEHGYPKYAKRAHSIVPVLGWPRGIGEIWRYKKVDPWTASIGVPFYVVKEFRKALSGGEAPYLSLDVRRVGRERLIQRVSFSTPGLFNE